MATVPQGFNRRRAANARRAASDRESCSPPKRTAVPCPPSSPSACCCWDWRFARWSPAAASPSLGPPRQERHIGPNTAPRDGGTGSKIVRTAARTARRSRPRRCRNQARRQPFPAGLPHADRPAERLSRRRVDRLRHRFDRRLRLWRIGRMSSRGIPARRRFRRGIVEGRVADSPSRGSRFRRVGATAWRYGSQCNEDCVGWSPEGSSAKMGEEAAKEKVRARRR